MPIYKVQAPDGSVMEIEAPEGASDQAILQFAAQTYKTPPPTVRDTGFTGAAKSSIEQIQADAYKTAGKLGIIPIKEAEEKSAQLERRAKQIFQPTEKGWTEAPGEKFRELLGGSLPYVAAPVAAAGVGMVAVPSAPVLAPAIAAGLASTAQFVGSDLGRQMETGKTLEQTNLGYATAAAVPQALLDTYSLGMTPLIRRMFASAGISLAEKEAVDIAKRGLMSTLKDYGGVTAKTATREGLTEAAQQSLERLQAGLNITDAEARKEYFDSFIGGFVLGGTLAPVGRYLEGPARPTDQGIRPPADQVNPLTDQPDTLTDTLTGQNLPGASSETFKQSPIDQGLAQGQQLYQQQAPLTSTTPIGGAIDTSSPLGQELSSTQAEIEALGKQNATLLAPEAATAQPTVAPEESAALALKLSEGLKQNPALRTQFEAAKQEFDTQGRLDLSQVFQTVLDTVPPVLTTPVIAPEVQQKIQEVRKTLIPALKQYGLEGTGLQILDSIGNGKAEGYHAQNLITVALDADNHLGAVRHETVHALKSMGAFTPQEWRVLTNKAKSDWIPQFITPETQQLYRQQYAQDNNGDMAGFDEYLQEEGIAEAFKHFNNKLPAGMVGNLMYRLKQFFQSLKNTFSGQGFNTSDSIFRGIEATKYKPKAPATTEGKFAKREPVSKAPEGIPQNIWDLHEKLLLAEAEASGRATPVGVGGRGKAPNALKRNQTMAFRRLNKAVTDFVGEEKSLDLMTRMNQESNRRESKQENGFDPNGYEPMIYKGDVSANGRRYSLLQHASRQDFDEIAERKLNAFGFGYGAYASVSQDMQAKTISKKDVTPTSMTYGRPYIGDTGYIYLADFPLTKENSIFPYESPDSQPSILNKFIEAGIIQPQKINDYYRTTQEYGDKLVFQMGDALTAMRNAYAEDMLISGYPMTGFIGENKPSGHDFNDKFGIQKRIADELDRMGIEATLHPYGDETHAVIHSPQKFNASLVGKYELKKDGDIKKISGRDLKVLGLFDKVKGIFSKKKVEKFKVKPEDLPSTNERRYSFVRKAKEGEKEISTQNASGVKAEFDPLTDIYSIDEKSVLEAMEKNPAIKARTIEAIKSYGFIPKDTADDQVIPLFKKSIVNNLLFLYNSVPAEIRNRSKLWYDGANKIAKQMGKEYGLTDMQVSGILAAMSPQKDWFQNVSMAERAIDILSKRGDMAWNADMLKYAQSYVKNTKDRKEREKRGLAYKKIEKTAKDGTKLKDMDIESAAAFVRAYDEAFHSRTYRIVTPEGGFSGLVMNNPDKKTKEIKPSTMMWSTYDPIEKSVSIFRNGNRDNISQQLGFEHKIRSFYNNIVAPNSDISHVTIDTHAVAAGLFEALAGTDLPVAQNFGGTGTADNIGVGGTYGLIADAYRDAANQVGMKAREMQSITWEAVRGLFNEDIKANIKAPIRGEWTKYRNGEQTFEQARTKIIKIAGGMNDPQWVGSDAGKTIAEGASSYDKSYQPEGGVRLREEMDIREKITVNLSNVTSSIQGLNELHQRSMNGDEKAYAVLQDVAKAHLEHLLSGTSAKVSIEPVMGAYGSVREPAINASLAFSETDRKEVMAAVARFATNFNQQQVHVRQATAYPLGHDFGDGSYVTPVFTLGIKRQLTNEELASVLEETGIDAVTISGKEKDGKTEWSAATYFVSNDKDKTKEEYGKFDEKIKLLDKALDRVVGRSGTKNKPVNQRLYVYGSGDGARLEYGSIAGDVRPKQAHDTRSSNLVANYFKGEPVTGFKQKSLNKAEIAAQKSLVEIFEALPNNDLKRPIVRRAYTALARELVEQYKILPIKVEVVTDVMMDGESYNYFSEKGVKEFKQALSRGMVEADADSAIKYLQDHYGVPDPDWQKKGGLLARIEADNKDIYPKELGSKAMRDDVNQNNRLKVYKTSPDTFGPTGSSFKSHPLLKPSGLKDANGYPMLYNDLLRAVHDYYSHNLTPAEFGAKGEFAAARNHLAVTKDPMAKWALIAETRLQNAWQNFRKGVEAIPLIDRPYAIQKAALPPIEYALSGDPFTDVAVRKMMETMTPEERLGSLPPSAPIAKKYKFSLRQPSWIQSTGTVSPLSYPASRIKAPDTPAFKQWFGKSKIVDAKGNPLVLYHGTARDITEFKPKQANAIFLTADPDFAESFSSNSINYMRNELLENNPDLKEEGANYVLDKAVKDGWLSKKEAKNYRDLYMSGLEPEFDNVISLDEQAFLDFLDQYLDTNQNILPLFASVENPFNFGDKEQVDVLNTELNKPEYNRFLKEGEKKYGDKNRGFIERGQWSTIESEKVQNALKKLGHDGFFVLEGGRKNLAVYDPAQVKSATGNIGTYSIDNPDIRFALNAPPKQLTAQTPVYTAGQQVQQAASAAHQVFTTDPNEFWTKLRINWVDPNAGLTKRLQNLPIFDSKGQLRADMLNRARAQSINLIKNGLTGGVPVLNTDGSIIIKDDAVNNLANSQLLADGLNGNQYVRDSGLDGRGYVAEVARALRGEEIMQEDAAHNAVNPPSKHLNREKQVDAAQIAWAKQQMQNVPELKDIFSIWKNVNTSLVDLWEKVGLLDAKTASEYRGKKSYVSLAASIADMEERMGEGFGHAYTGTKGVKKIQRLEGSDLFRNIWENVSKQYASMLAGAYQNQTRKVAVEQLGSLGLAKITNPTDPDINLRYKDQNHPQANKEGIVSVVVDNPNDVAAFESMHYQLSPIMKAMSGATGVLRAGALLNPMFWIRQLIRDPIQASLTNSPIVTPLHSAKEYISILRRDSAEARLLAERGVIGPVDSTLDLQEFLETAGQKFAGRNKTSAMLSKLMEMHEASDAATRVAIYKKAKQEALARGLNDVDATNEAVYKSRESINFAVRGNSPTLAALRHMTPFLSAAISSLDVLYKAATGYGLPPKERAEARAMFKRRAMMMGAMSIAYAMMMQDDEEYKKVPDYIRDSNWLIHNPFGDGFIKIPTPFEVGFLLKTIPEGMVRYISGNSTGKQVVKSYLNGLANSLPGDAVPLPQLIKPAVEAITNYSLFTFSPIESIGESKLPVELRGRRASETAKVLSEAGLGKLGLSPAKLDHLIQGYLAEWGTFTTFLVDKAVTESKGITPMDKNLARQPFFKSFITDTTRDKVVGDFYELYRTANEISAAVKDYKSSGAYEAIKEIYADEDKVKLLRVAPALNRIADNMGKINSQIRLIQNSQNIPPDERLSRVNELQAQLARVARQHLRLSESLGI
jgi:hypothetical protein